MSAQPLVQTHHTDYHGNPKGGETIGLGIHIRWQDGKLVEQHALTKVLPGTGIVIETGFTEDFRLQPNGCFVETVIQAARDRLAYYQTTRFESDFNMDAIAFLDEALGVLASRTSDRATRGVEGTHLS